MTAVDVLFGAGLLANLVKGGDLLLSKRQKTALQERFEAFTVWLDDLRPIEWFGRLPRPKPAFWWTVFAVIVALFAGPRVIGGALAFLLDLLRNAGVALLSGLATAGKSPVIAGGKRNGDWVPGVDSRFFCLYTQIVSSTHRLARRCGAFLALPGKASPLLPLQRLCSGCLLGPMPVGTGIVSPGRFSFIDLADKRNPLYSERNRVAYGHAGRMLLPVDDMALRRVSPFPLQPVADNPALCHHSPNRLSQTRRLVAFKVGIIGREELAFLRAGHFQERASSRPPGTL